MNLRARLGRYLGYEAPANKAVLFGALSPLFRLAAGPVTTLLVALYFTPELQGYYFTFNHLTFAYVFAELGLGLVVVNFASHEWARLHRGQRGEIAGDRAALSRLTSLGRLAGGCYAALGFTVAGGLAGIGEWVLAADAGTAVAWRSPWYALCALTGVRVCLLAPWYLLEGCNQTRQVYRARLVETVCLTLGTWAGLGLGAGLWAAVIGQCAGLAWSLLFFAREYGSFFAALRRPPSGPVVRWRGEIWPLQWKLAIDHSGYFVIFAYAPLLFRYHGAAAAGQWGMTWSLVGALSAAAAALISVQAPRFGALVARGEFAALDRLFSRTALVLCAAMAIGGAALWGGVSLLYASGHPLAPRLLPPLPTALLVLAACATQLVSVQATYLRAHKESPFYPLSIAGGLGLGLAALLLGRPHAALGMAAGYLAVYALAVLPLATLIRRRYRTRRETGGDHR